MKKILYSKFWLVLWVLGFAFAGAQTKPAKPVSNGDKMYCKSDARFPDLSVQAPTDATVVATKWNLVAPIDAAIKNSITGLPIYKKGDIIPTLYDGSVPVNIEKTGLTYNFSDITNNSGQSSTPSTLTHSELTFAVWNENAAGVPSDYTFVKMSVETFPELTPDPLKTFCSIKENITLKVTPKTALKTGQQIVWYLDDNEHLEKNSFGRRCQRSIVPKQHSNF
ncbi:MAG: hypothetical protein C4K58_00895 [Flavobacteriaceae bacterium]|nr:MAG: hypothetical protein C4K58_00895 [Flavobacteriaceae bacterium]